VIDRKALKYLLELPEQNPRLIKAKCHALAKDPFPAIPLYRTQAMTGPGPVECGLAGTQAGMDADSRRVASIEFAFMNGLHCS